MLIRREQTAKMACLKCLLKQIREFGVFMPIGLFFLFIHASQFFGILSFTCKCPISERYSCHADKCDGTECKCPSIKTDDPEGGHLCHCHYTSDKDILNCKEVKLTKDFNIRPKSTKTRCHRCRKCRGKRKIEAHMGVHNDEPEAFNIIVNFIQLLQISIAVPRGGGTISHSHRFLHDAIISSKLYLKKVLEENGNHYVIGPPLVKHDDDKPIIGPSFVKHDDGKATTVPTKEELRQFWAKHPRRKHPFHSMMAIYARVAYVLSIADDYRFLQDRKVVSTFDPSVKSKISKILSSNA